MSNAFKRGFTLIELLVVIAIIGVLSAVVLASLSTARQRGADTGIKGNLRTIQNQGDLFFVTTGGNSYGTAVATNSCTTAGTMFVVDTVIARAIAAANSANGPSMGITCNSSATAYAVQAQLPSTANTWWCVDSTGKAVQVTAAMVAGATACI